MRIRHSIILFLLISLIVITDIAAADDEKYTYYAPIRSIDLGVEELVLTPGDVYTFKVNYVPAETPPIFLDWLTDETIIEIDPEKFTIIAKKSGTARLLVESNGGFVWDYCDITVNDTSDEKSHEKNPTEKRTGVEMINITTADRKKIKAESFLNYLSFVEYSSFSNEQFEKIGQRVFNVTASVKPGSVESEKQRAVLLGMEKAVPLPDLDAVSLRGTFTQILDFVSNNQELVELFEFAPMYNDDAIAKDDETVEKDVNLEGYVESLTKVSLAHNLRFTGENTVIALIDTGINKNHEQFAGRVIADACYAGPYGSYLPVCSSGSSVPSLSRQPAIHNHGSMVAGVAAGRDGIAPKAKIVSIGASAEYCNGYDCSQTLSFDLYEIVQYLTNLQKSYKKAGKPLITAVNMSWGSEVYSSTCDFAEKYYKEAFDLLIKNGMIPVKSSGNGGSDGGVSSPGCLSNSFTVGALYDRSTPTIAPYSNHSPMVDILAPGSNIRTALYAYDDRSSINYCSTGGNCYGRAYGTSIATPMVTGAFAILKQANPEMTVAQLEKELINISTRTANYRPAGSEFSYTLTNPAQTFSYSKPILDFTNIGYSGLNSFSIKTNNIRGYTRGITVKFIPPSNVWSYYVGIRSDRTGKDIVYDLDITLETSGEYHVLRFAGDIMEIGGHPYEIRIQPYRKADGVQYLGNTKIIYGSPNPRITAITVTPGDKSAIFRVVRHKYADGFRYNIYLAGNTSRFSYIDVSAAKSSTVSKVTGLTNGKLYYVTAIPYTNIRGNKYWGASKYRIYFVPLSAPSGTKVKFVSNTKAKVSIASDSAANGINVLYRKTGGSLVQGCEALGNSCTISKLNKNAAYEFYVMKFKKINGKKYYSPGKLVNYRSTSSGLPAPKKPLIAKRSGSKLSFTVPQDSKAIGISVLYREGEGYFKLACEAKGKKSQLTCEKSGFNFNKKYTFYIMQFRVVNGKKVYSPGISVTNWLTPNALASSSKSAASVASASLDNEKGVFTTHSETMDLYKILDDYYTEGDLLLDEALKALDSKMLSDKAASEIVSVIEEELKRSNLDGVRPVGIE